MTNDDGDSGTNDASLLPSLFAAIGSETTVMADDEIKSRLFSFLDALGPREDVLILPPDFTRYHSNAGKITRYIAEYYGFIEVDDGNKIEGSGETRTAAKDNDKLSSETANLDDKNKSTPTIEIMPTLGTHAPMTNDQIHSMFGVELATMQPSPFMVHDWRNDVVTIGHAPAEMVSRATNGMVNQPWPAQLNKKVWAKRRYNPNKQPHKSLVLSIGQVVPHEVMGMANFNKNLFVGVGGVEAINLSHFIGAVHGMEKIMGRASNPLRSILNYASETYLQQELDLWYILTVMGTNDVSGNVEMRGLYIGNNIECYNKACNLSLKVNFTLVDKPLTKVVVYLNEDEFHSTWLGNKAIYRTRMAIADGGELIILAPGVRKFGEDKRIDELIRKYGYVGTDNILKAMDENKELQDNLSAVAHLIHGSSEGRFNVTYCPGHLCREEIESVGFTFGDPKAMNALYNVKALKDGWNAVKSTEDGSTREEIYYISNPALGLWAFELGNDAFEASEQASGAAKKDVSNQH